MLKILYIIAKTALQVEVVCCYMLQALTNPLARLPGIARNDHRATIFVGWSCPPNLYFENSGNKRFPPSTSCSLHTLCALDLERCSAKCLSLSVESPFVQCLNGLISTVFSLIIWLVKYCTMIWIINDIMQIRRQYLEWLSIVQYKTVVSRVL